MTKLFEVLVIMVLVLILILGVGSEASTYTKIRIPSIIKKAKYKYNITVASSTTNDHVCRIYTRKSLQSTYIYVYIL